VYDDGKFARLMKLSAEMNSPKGGLETVTGGVFVVFRDPWLV
jgi:hypothetical protein